MGAIVPGILSSVAATATDPSGLGRLVDTVGSIDTDSLNQVGSMIGGPSQGALIKEGAQMLSAVVGNGPASALTEAIASYAGLSVDASQGLVGLAVPAVLGALSELKRSTSIDANELSRLLVGQKDTLIRAMPPGLRSSIAPPNDHARPLRPAAVRAGSGTGPNGIAVWPAKPSL